MMGVSTVYSLSKIIQQEGRGAAVKRVVRRSVICLLLPCFIPAASPIRGRICA